jgi:hypothetical protein
MPWYSGICWQYLTRWTWSPLPDSAPSGTMSRNLVVLPLPGQTTNTNGLGAAATMFPPLYIQSSQGEIFLSKQKWIERDACVVGNVACQPAILRSAGKLAFCLLMWSIFAPSTSIRQSFTSHFKLPSPFVQDPFHSDPFRSDDKAPWP